MQNKQNECAPSEDSDQPGLSPSLIKAFAVRMKNSWVLIYPLSAQRRLIRLGAHSFCWFCHVMAHIIKLTAMNFAVSMMYSLHFSML